MTDSFLNTVRGAHKAVFRAKVVAPGQTGVNPLGVEIPVNSGDVTSDTTADITSTADLTTSLAWPVTPTAPGAPYGQEIYLERGVQYGNGIREFVGLGYFRIDSVEQDRTPNGKLHIGASDRMVNVRDGRNIAPYQFGPSASVGAVIDQVIGEVVPNLVTVYDFPAYAVTLGTSHVVDEDRLKFVRDLVAAYGKVMYFDYAGRLQVKSPPAQARDSVWTINHGRGGVLVSMKRAISRDGIYNAVVARGESTGELPPVQGIAYDNDPASPTRWGGPFGKVPKFYSSAFLNTPKQCSAAAASMLLSANGLPYTVSLGTVPNAALEAWDVVTVTYDDHASAQTHIIDRITYALSADGAMGIDTRRQYLT
ncbi:DUF5047 domain-containing protein [Amycolatopsis sp. H20-H5]|uniref:DUF5047 domain-containing protein n=1 Tax=Amycolatopsis sp. H20-H5 TaxID=3046309 RepID=UPI002DB86500|nr:DUF5047 domain-containing protein [Amycolatopsis sp. H20-H5]MEC3975082.1 DUF5047 domain-containing protein [Amycolatopsis sp. H20-H5]